MIEVRPEQRGVTSGLLNDQGVLAPRAAWSCGSPGSQVLGVAQPSDIAHI
jgi:hypothetical protein